MSREEYARHKRQTMMQTAIAEKQEAAERFVEKLKQRHDNPSQPLKVKPLESDNIPAPVGDGLSKLF